MSYLNLVVEDNLQFGLLRKIIREVRPDMEFGEPIGRRGNDYIKQNLRSYNEASRHLPFLILTDLDQDACPIALIKKWITFDKHPNLLFRIAVREAEAWLLADRGNLAKFLSVAVSRISLHPETIDDPKQYLIGLARRSRRREIREDIVPIGTAKAGPAYNLQLAQFIDKFWNWEVAQQNSESLSRLIRCLQNFQPVTNLSDE